MSDKPKKEEGKPGLIAVMKAAAEKKELEAKPPLTDGAESSAASKLASNPNLPKSTPPVFVTEMSKPDLKLPAIREENTQDEIVVKGANDTSASKAETNKDKTDFTANATREPDVSDAIIIDPSTRPKKNKASSENGKSPSVKNGKSSPLQNGHVSPFGPHKPTTSKKGANNNNRNEIVPNLPALGGGKNAQDTDRSNETERSAGWEAALKFVNQRIQDRLTMVRNASKRAKMNESLFYKR